jgi:hypothetical protein
MVQAITHAVAGTVVFTAVLPPLQAECLQVLAQVAPGVPAAAGNQAGELVLAAVSRATKDLGAHTPDCTAPCV